MKNQRGFTLIEIVVAVGIMGIITYAGVSAYQYFMGQSKKELKKLDDISEFTLFAKDVAKLAEGAGISTFYLNFPVSKVCNDVVDGLAKTPCLQTLDTREDFQPVASGSLPSVFNDTNKQCIQFFSDKYARLEVKRAFPDNATREERLKYFENFVLNNNNDLYATWPLIDQTSKPFVVMKRRTDNTVFHLAQSPISSDNPATNNSFFYTEGNVITSQYEGFPFLVYSSVFLDQYSVKIAQTVKNCSEALNKALCLQQARKYNRCVYWQGSPVPATLPGCPFFSAKLPIKSDNLYMIEFKPVDTTNAFFANLKSDSLPASSNCTDDWDSARQDTNFHLFPTKTFSIQPPLSGLNMGWGTGTVAAGVELKVQSLAHFYEGWTPAGGSLTEGVVMAVPIDIVSYFIQEETNGAVVEKNLMAQIYSEIQTVTPRAKIRKLKAPFYFARKLGTQELSMWYNPK